MTRVRRYRYEKRPWSLNAERSGGRGGHGHWSKTRAVTAEWREAFHILGLQSRARFGSAFIVVEISMKKPLADTGNAYGAVKAAIDGLVDARVLPGDGPDFVLGLAMLRPNPTTRNEPDAVTLTLVEGGNTHEQRCPLCVVLPSPRGLGWISTSRA